MKKIINYLLIASLAVAALACQDLKKEPGTGKAEPAMKGVFYADIPGEKTPVEIAPGASKTYSLKACAFRSNVTDIVMNFSFKVNEEAVSAYNEANGTSYVMCPGSAFEFLTNEVMLPRYGKASTTARLKVTASGLEKDVTYMLPVTLDKARQTESWSLADTLAAYVLLTLGDFDPNGPGTENNPYPITTVEELRNMGDLLEEGMKTYFRLDADLDMAGVMDWEPINTGSPFKPIYLDGDMHTISNFSGKTSLFGGVAGSISNLIITGANIENAAGPVGILGSYGGETDNPVTVEHVYVQGKITNKVAHGTGGLFGCIAEATINACSADVEIDSDKYDSGGIYGYDNSAVGKRSVVSDCWTSGDITGNRMVGGIAGMMSQNESECIIRNCYSTARVHAQFKYGGIVGDAIMGLKGDNATKTAKNHIEKCIAWNNAVFSDVKDDGVHYSAGAVVGFTSLKNYHVDCFRRADLDFSDCPGNNTNALVDHENSSPDTPLVEKAVSPGSTNYNFPYHGKSAAAGATASQVAKNLGWDESIWDLSGPMPLFKGGLAPIQDVDTGGQLPDFGENDFYN